METASDRHVPRLLTSPDLTQVHAVTLSNVNKMLKIDRRPHSSSERNSLPTAEELERFSIDLNLAISEAKAECDEIESQFSASSSTTTSLLAETETALSRFVEDIDNAHGLHLRLEDEVLDRKAELLSETSLLGELETLHGQAKALEGARSYFGRLEAAEKHCIDAIRHVQSNTSAALKSLEHLIAYSLSIDDASLPSQSRMAFFVRAMCLYTWDQLKVILSKVLLDAADGIQWPTSTEVPLDDEAPNVAAFKVAFSDLVRLHRIRRDNPTHFQDDARTEALLLPLEVLIRPLILRFRYHFDGQRKTNRLDKPEWYFAHVLNALAQHQSFIKIELQALLSNGGYSDIDAMTDFITLFLQPLDKKLRTSAPQLLTMPPVFAHTVYQTLQFDAGLQEKYGYVPRAARSWSGLADVLLGNAKWFQNWLEAERIFVDDKFFAIISTPDAWQISTDYADSNSGTLRPTNSALRIRDLIDLVTDRYKPLPGLKYKLAFLTSIQLPVLEAYRSRISSAVDAFETLSTGLIRAVPGALGEGSGARLTTGVSGLQRIIRAGISARWFHHTCEAWSEDVFFLELWQDVQDAVDPEVAVMSQQLMDIKSRMDGLLFYHQSKAFAELAERTDRATVQHIVREITGELKAYISKRWDFDAQHGEGETAETGLTPEFLGALTLFSALIFALAHSLPPLLVAPLYRSISSSLATFLYTRLATSKVFSEQGGLQLYTDIQNGFCVAAKEAGISRPEAGWSQIREASTLLALPSSASTSSAGNFSISKAMQAAWDDGLDADKFSEIVGEIGVKELDRKSVQAVLRRRPEVWR